VLGAHVRGTMIRGVKLGLASVVIGACAGIVLLLRWALRQVVDAPDDL